MVGYQLTELYKILFIFIAVVKIKLVIIFRSDILCRNIINSFQFITIGCLFYRSDPDIEFIRVKSCAFSLLISKSQINRFRNKISVPCWISSIINIRKNIVKDHLIVFNSSTDKRSVLQRCKIGIISALLYSDRNAHLNSIKIRRSGFRTYYCSYSSQTESLRRLGNSHVSGIIVTVYIVTVNFIWNHFRSIFLIAGNIRSESTRLKSVCLCLEQIVWYRIGISRFKRNHKFKNNSLTGEQSTCELKVDHFSVKSVKRDRLYVKWRIDWRIIVELDLITVIIYNILFLIIAKIFKCICIKSIFQLLRNKFALVFKADILTVFIFNMPCPLRSYIIKICSVLIVYYVAFIILHCRRRIIVAYIVTVYTAFGIVLKINILEFRFGQWFQIRKNQYNIWTRKIILFNISASVAFCWHQCWTQIFICYGIF